MKRALSVGINYPGTSHSLQGCVNDSYMIEALLRTHYGFDDITLLLDNKATTANIISALNNLVDRAVPGDVLFFHYSGHGSQLPDKDQDDDFEPDGLDEIICPVDLDWKTKVIRDDDLKAIFDRVPNGVNLTVFLDCCNSGGGMDHLNQYQSLAPGERVIRKTTDGNRYLRPPQKIMEFAESRALMPKPRTLSRNIDHTGLMISGCQAQQTSADAYIDGKYRGAATYYLNNTLNQIGHDASYLEIVDRLNKDIAAAGFTQRPELNGPANLFDQPFISDYSQFDESPAPVVTAPIVVEDDPIPTPAPAEDDDDDKSKTIKIVLAVAAIAAIVYFVMQGGV